MKLNIYDEAILIQNATNPKGVLSTMEKWAERLTLVDPSFDFIQHPALQLMWYQYAQLDRQFWSWSLERNWDFLYGHAEKYSVKYMLNGDGYAVEKPVLPIEELLKKDD